MDKKAVARHARGFIGGRLVVERYYNVDESKAIDIMSSTGAIRGIQTCATIGLSETDLCMSVREKRLSVELLAAGRRPVEHLGKFLAELAFEIADTHRCSYGTIIPNAVAEYQKNTMMKHVVLMSPVFWRNYTNLEADDKIVSWLMVVPISDNERQFIANHGLDAFDRLLEVRDADITDVHRQSVI